MVSLVSSGAGGHSLNGSFPIIDGATMDDQRPPEGFASQMLERATLTTQFLKALSHPSRLVLLCRLAEGPATVGEMEEMLGLPQAEVSKQLARLRADGLVATRRDGRNVTYSVKDDSTVRVVKLLHSEFCALP